MKRVIVACICMILLLGLAGCGEKEEPIYGTWEFCGVMDGDDMLIDQEYLEEWNLDEMDDITLKIDEDGLKKTLKRVPGIETGELIKKSDKEYTQEIKGYIVDGEKIDNPITDRYVFRLDGEFLIVKEEFPDSDFDNGMPNVYRKK